MKFSSRQILIVGVAVLALTAGIFYLNSLRPAANPASEFIPEGIVIYTPESDELVSFPLTIRGRITGDAGWIAFEGHAGTVQAFDDEGPISEIAALNVSGDWTILPASFGAFLGSGDNVNQIRGDAGYLLFRNENTSGEPQNERELRLPVRFKE